MYRYHLSVEHYTYSGGCSLTSPTIEQTREELLQGVTWTGEWEVVDFKILSESEFAVLWRREYTIVPDYDGWRARMIAMMDPPK